MGAELVQLRPDNTDLLLVVQLAFFQLPELIGMPEMGGDEVAVVKKQHPDHETNQGKQVFVPENRRYVVEDGQM